MTASCTNAAALAGQRIVVGITGGVAAYKALTVLRLLRQAGAEVEVVLTAAAQSFVTPLSVQALSGREVHTELMDPSAEAAMGHIALARWATRVVIVPATAHCLAKYAQGMADDLLSTLCLATNAPIILVPAMNQAMWSHPAVQANVACLQARGARLMPPAVGEQACGEHGAGRLPEPDAIIDYLSSDMMTSTSSLPLTGKTVLVTAGPTREALDPVRYLSNHSSGKMGYAIAAALLAAGARVELVSGPTALSPPEGAHCIDVVSASDMHQAVMERVGEVDAVIAVAAVADYTLATPSIQKMKKTTDALTLTLARTPDIVADIAELPQRPLLIAFAAETEDVVANAVEKRRRKGADVVIANDVSGNAVFGADEAVVHLVTADAVMALPLQSKARIASHIVKTITPLVCSHC